MVSLYLKDLVNYLKGRMTERKERKIEGVGSEKEIFHLLIYYPDGLNGHRNLG